MKQNIEYQIFIVAQTFVREFNRGALFNVGFIEAMKMKQWDCIIFHDVDMLPIDNRNLYTCSKEHPQHYSEALDSHNFKTIYPTFFGGVCAMTPEQFRKVNGYSNLFWGWGGEDDDFYRRFDSFDHLLNPFRSTYSKFRKYVTFLLNQSRISWIRCGKTSPECSAICCSETFAIVSKSNSVIFIIIYFCNRQLNKFNG